MQITKIYGTLYTLRAHWLQHFGVLKVNANAHKVVIGSTFIGRFINDQLDGDNF